MVILLVSRYVLPSPIPEGSHDGLAKNSTWNVPPGVLFSEPVT